MTGQRALTSSKSLGDVDEGDHNVDLQVGPFTIDSASSIGIAYLIVNSGFSGTEVGLRIALDIISNITAGALSWYFGPASIPFWAALNAATILINQLFTANSDGPVAANMTTLSSGQLAQMTSGGVVYSETNRCPGTDSDIGCGSNSDYSATWSIMRM
jgi:hypothetical protein